MEQLVALHRKSVVHLIRKDLLASTSMRMERLVEWCRRIWQTKSKACIKQIEDRRCTDGVVGKACL